MVPVQVQREALPTHESFLTFSTMDANEELAVTYADVC